MAAPEAMRFGCSPEVDAYSGEEFRPPSPRTTLRTGAGHIHIDDEVAREYPLILAKALDLYLGIPSLLLDTSGAERRELYGRAGSIRHKDYGIEYRVLSNFWTADEKLISWVWQQVERAIGHVKASMDIPCTIQETISNNDLSMAGDLCVFYSLLPCKEEIR